MRAHRILVMLALVLGTLSCPGEDPVKLDRSGVVGEGGNLDKYVCKQPPNIAEGCVMPPSGYSQDRIHCLGCNCAGPSSAAACNTTNGDCRYFNDGCIPKSYSRCDGSVNDQFLLGLCGYCFFREAGGIPKECNHILFDAGAGKQ
jgi:hypothetical protein